ncbi:MAG TPA: hypothetical protein DD490_13025 [Acidobacteria bacterium]|nr:hypothetical protein [Acidobacteriota bacterium]
MKKNATKKLALSRETLVRLNGPALGYVDGGAWSDDSVCPTTGPSDHGRCRGLDRSGNPNDPAPTN